MRRPPVHVTSLGAYTSLGDSVVACAGARAGLSRPTVLEVDAFDSEEGPVPIVGHPIAAAVGFQGEARLLVLALPALEDLLRDVSGAARAQTGLLLALPDLGARAARVEAPPPVSIGLLDRLCAAAGLARSPERTRVFATGPVGFADAIQAGMGLLAEGQAERIVVGAVDTLCDDLALAALAAEDRLKTGENPVGLQPGEAAAFVLLESTDAVRRGGTKPLASLVAVGLGQETVEPDALPTGRGIVDVVSQVIANSSPLAAGAGWFVGDQNGEVARAHDWGRSYLYLQARLPTLVPAPEWYPAIHFGDTGAASAVLGVQMAIRAFARGYAPGSSALVLSASDDGRRSAIRVDRPR